MARRPDRPAAGAAPTRALDRGLRVLEAVAARPGATLAEIAEACALSPATALRILETLRGRDFVARDPGRRTWSVGLKSFEVGARFLSETRLHETCRLILQRLAAETGQTATLAILHEREVIYVDVAEGSSLLRSTLRVGARASAHASASGKALLAWRWEAGLAGVLGPPPYPAITPNTITSAEGLRAELARVRRAGLARDREESQPDISCLAAPVRDRSGDVIAALGMQGLTGQIAEREAELAALLAAGAEEASNRLGWRPAPADDRGRGSPLTD